MTIPSKQDIEDAAKRIAPHIRQTPVLTSSGINEMFGADLYFKCENFQKVGAFKFRGAMNAVNQLSDAELKHGVATHSSGNHAQALSLAAKIKRVKAYIVMPSNAPKSKKEAVLGYGAEVIECDPTLEARESALMQVVRKTNACFIHPYDDVRIIAGQATCAMELLEKVRDLDTVVAPVGGGGLLSGTALSVRYFAANTLTVGAEPAGADDAFRSFRAGKIIPSSNPKTIADGLLTSLGEHTFPVIKKHVDKILTVDDEQIALAMKLIWQRMKIIVEPSAAVPLALVMENLQLFKNKKVGMILSGGNVDFDKLPF